MTAFFYIRMGLTVIHQIMKLFNDDRGTLKLLIEDTQEKSLALLTRII